MPEQAAQGFLNLLVKRWPLILGAIALISALTETRLQVIYAVSAQEKLEERVDKVEEKADLNKDFNSRMDERSEAVQRQLSDIQSDLKALLRETRDR